MYQNGVRMNEPFGDTVSWDLIPMSAVQSVQLLAGSSPVFGLNSLGGALSLQMKDGFTFDRTAAEAYGGSFSRRGATVQHGGNSGRWGYYANLDYFEEDGWRDYSDSDALRFFGSASMQGERGRLDVSAAIADSELRGNGPAPAELLLLDRSQVFTHPDITENALTPVDRGGLARPVQGIAPGRECVFPRHRHGYFQRRRHHVRGVRVPGEKSSWSKANVLRTHDDDITPGA